ncbi:MAG: zinc ABC transporter substrate-binding protein [Actinomycetota bacterium]|nr:zinc ABC transporter substrate-binding protein [Actinomycetota bacterium]
MTLRMRRRGMTAAALSAAVTLVGCGSTADSGQADDSSVSVIASTNVWGSVVAAVAGDAVEVTTLIDDPSADPHSYESTPADAAAVTNADVVVFNGGGYDEFMTEILGTLDGKPAVNAFELADAGRNAHGHEADGEAHAEGEAQSGEADVHAHESGVNEHVWYELPAVEAVAEQVAEELGRLLPEQAATFAANATSFHEGIDVIAAQVAAIGEANPGARVALTEPIAVYLIEDAGLGDATPPEFLQAVEEETDPPAAAVAATRRLMTDRQVAALIYNPQTETPVTEQVRSDAEAAGIPVVEMTETLPGESGYLEWMTAQVEALASALQR